jgi:hypothetical protein
MSRSRYQSASTRIRICVLGAVLSVLLPGYAAGQDVVSWLSWTALQAIPSPTFTVDAGDGNHRLATSFRWQVTPISYSWSANELVSPVSVMMVNPVRRLAGSAEIFLQPEISMANLQNSGLGKSSLGIGSRAFFPVDECGEYLSVSFGAKYLIRHSLDGNAANTFAGEIGLYSLFGLIGMQLSIGADPAARYSFSIYLKYY